MKSIILTRHFTVLKKDESKDRPVSVNQKLADLVNLEQLSSKNWTENKKDIDCNTDIELNLECSDVELRY